MTNIINKLNRINELKLIKGIGIGLILYINLLFISIFAQYYSDKLIFENPFIPKENIFLMFEPYAKKGFILSMGFPVILILKFIRQNFLVIITAMMIILAYYLTNNTIDWKN